MPSSRTPVIHDQENLLPKRQVIVLFLALSFGLLVTFIDQNSIGVALPTIGRELDCAATVEWAGTASLIANTAFQVLYGRMSDVFGRKVMLITMLAVLSIGDLLSGFAQTGPQLYAFRGIAGMANGGIMALTMMVVSDVVTLEERGRYQGILGSCVGAGNAVGPFIAASFTEHTSWRDTFYLLTPLAVVAAIILYIRLPPQKIPKEDFKVVVQKIDWTGIFLVASGIILILIPVSGIGTRFNAKSPMVISMLILGLLCLIGFVLNEWKLARLPILPQVRLFKSVPLSAMLMQNLLFGIVWYSEQYFLPIYYQSARQLSVSTSALLILPLVLGLTIMSTCSGQYISRMNRYGEVIWVGFTVWTLCTGLHFLLGRHTQLWKIVIIMVVQGMGVGCVFSPTLVAAQAHSPKADRAVVISARNFLRSLGGAIGLAIASAIFSNSFHSHLPSDLPPDLAEVLHGSTFSAPDLSSVDVVTRNRILDAYMAASRSLFVMWVSIIGCCLLLVVFIKDKGLQRKEETQQQSTGGDNSNEETGSIEKMPRTGEADAKSEV